MTYLGTDTESSTALHSQQKRILISVSAEEDSNFCVPGSPPPGVNEGRKESACTLRNEPLALDRQLRPLRQAESTT